MANYQRFHGNESVSHSEVAANQTVSPPAVATAAATPGLEPDQAKQLARYYHSTAGLVTGIFHIICACCSMVMAMVVMYQVTLTTDLPEDTTTQSHYREDVDDYKVFSNVSFSFWAGISVSK